MRAVASPVDSEQAFLALIAARPSDRALRRVFADWLLERDDPRGEELALWAKSELTAAERRRFDRLSRANLHKWLGSLARAIAVDREEQPQCRVEGGLLTSVRLAPMPLEEWAALVGDRRLATVEAIALEPARIYAPPPAFLAHPVLRNLKRLECGPEALHSAGSVAFSLEWLKLHSWQYPDEIEALPAFAGLGSVRQLVLALHQRAGDAEPTVVEQPVAERLVDELLAAKAVKALDAFELDLHCTTTLEGAARVLLSAAAQMRRARRRSLARFALRYYDTLFTLHGDMLQFLEIDVSDPTGDWTVGARVAHLPSVIALLGGAALERIEIKAPPGGRFTKQELSALRIARRRLRSLEALVVAGVLQPP